jgi:hypothetical protein
MVAKAVSVIEMAPSNTAKFRFLKSMLVLDEATKAVLEVKGVRKEWYTLYLYKLDKVEPDLSLTDSFFTFDSKKNPSVKVIDLR